MSDSWFGWLLEDGQAVINWVKALFAFHTGPINQGLPSQWASVTGHHVTCDAAVEAIPSLAVGKSQELMDWFSWTLR